MLEEKASFVFGETQLSVPRVSRLALKRLQVCSVCSGSQECGSTAPRRTRSALESEIARLQGANLEDDDLIRLVALLKSKIGIECSCL